MLLKEGWGQYPEGLGKNRLYLVSKFPNVTENLEAQIDYRVLQIRYPKLYLKYLPPLITK